MLQVVIALAAIPVLRRPGRGWVLIPIFAAIAFAMAGRLNSVDELSTTGRTAVQDRILSDVRADPGSFLTGRDQYTYFLDAIRHAGGQALVNAFAGFETVPIHNFLLSNLVTGGWLAFLALVGAYATMLIVVFRRWLADRSDPISQTLLVAAVLVTFESAIEPIAANIAGLWIVFGFVLGRGLPSKRSANEVPAHYPPQNETLTPSLPRSANRA